MKSSQTLAFQPSLIGESALDRLLNFIPGAITWLFLVAPVALSFIRPTWVAYLIIAFDLAWLQKSLRLSLNIVRGYRRMRWAKRVDWLGRWDWIIDPENNHQKLEQQFYTTSRYRRGNLKAALSDLRRLEEHQATNLDPRNIYNVALLATYNESYEVLEASVLALTRVNYPLDHLMLVIAYEERGGEKTEQNVQKLMATYGQRFGYATAVQHPDGIVGEVRGKAGNITWAGRELAAEIHRRGIDPQQVIVTTLDADNRTDPNYFACLTYTYCVDPNRVHRSYQPIPIYHNNIWDAPPPILSITTGNSFWLLMETMRPHRLRNFSAHAQSLQTLLDTDFWSTKTINEDGHQYWRTYFAYDGDHMVTPIYVPVYQDAVVAGTVWRTLKMQYVQLRRWAWGVTDFRYVVLEYMRHPEINRFEKILNTWRLLEGHFSWATAPLILAFAAWAPLLLNPQFNNSTLAHLLPVIASRILTLATVGVLVSALLCFIMLPPRPKHYSRIKNVLALLQWFLMPVTAIVFSAFTAIDAQTRLMLGKSLDWVVTEKVRKV